MYDGMYASDVSSPAEMVATYGDASVRWGFPDTILMQRACSEGYTHARRQAGWSAYLELARIRERSHGEG
jgi:hypothetical protein